MRPSPVRDLIVGLFVLAGLIAIGYLALSLGGLTTKGPGGVVLYATFDEIGGLKHRAPVRVAGRRRKLNSTRRTAGIPVTDLSALGPP